jgi:hypothetical protein
LPHFQPDCYAYAVLIRQRLTLQGADLRMRSQGMNGAAAAANGRLLHTRAANDALGRFAVGKSFFHYAGLLGSDLPDIDMDDLI